MKSSEINISQQLKIILKGSISAFIGRIFYTGFAFILSIIIARLYGAEIMGEFFLCFTVISILSVFSAMGLNNGLLKFIPIYDSEKKYEYLKGTLILVSLFVFAVASIYALILYFSSNLISYKIFKDPELKIGLRIFSFILPLYAVKVIFQHYFRGLKQITKSVFLETYIYYPSLIVLIIIFYFLFREHSLKDITLSLALSVIIVIIAGSFFFLKSIPEFFKTKLRTEFKKVLTFSYPLFFVAISGLLMQWIDIVMLGIFRSSAEVGIYTAASRIAQFVSFFLVAVNYINPSIFSELYHKGQMEELEKVARTTSTWLLKLSLPIALFFILFSKQVMNIYGGEFVKGNLALIFLSIGQLINAGVGSVGFILAMTENQNTLSFLFILSAILNGILNYLLIPKLGVTGAGIATGISLGVLNISMTSMVIMKNKIKPYPYNLKNPLLLFSISLFILFLAQKFISFTYASILSYTIFILLSFYLSLNDLYSLKNLNIKI